MKTPPDELTDRLLAASEGILGASTPIRFDDIAEEVGVGRATLYYYFSGRDDLLSFVLAEHIRRGAKIIDDAQGDTPGGRLRAAVVGLVHFLGANPELCPALLAAMGGAGRMHEALEANEIFIATPIQEIIRAGLETGEFAPGRPDDLTSAVLGAVMMQVLTRHHRGEPMGSDLDVEAITDLAMRILIPAQPSPKPRTRDQ